MTPSRDSKGRFTAKFKNVPSWFRFHGLELVRRNYKVLLVQQPKGPFSYLIVASWPYTPSLTAVTEVALNYLKKEVKNGYSKT